MKLLALGLGLVLGGLVPAALGSQPAPVEMEELKAHVHYLAADRLAGRSLGEPGIARAEDYIAAEFARYGLEPLPGEDDFFVDFTLYRDEVDRQATTLEFLDGDVWSSREVGVDFRPFGFSDSGEVEGDVVFAGYGITAAEHDWNDYEGLDVRGKIVLVLRHEPNETDPESVFDGARHSVYARFDAKARNARNRGARGLILVTDPLHHERGEDLRLGGNLELDPPAAPEPTEEPFLAVHVSRNLAGSLIGEEIRLEDLQRAVDGGRRPSELGVTARRVRLQITPRWPAERIAARNVAGFLAGSDPKLRHQWVVVGGHHDHLGSFTGDGASGTAVEDRVYNGADDNASGTAGVLALARAFAARAAAGERPRRSLLFMTFTAEERGLLGSRWMVENRRIPIDRTVFMINLDMIGRNADRALRVVGDGFSDGTRRLVEKANAAVGLDLAFSGSGYTGASDHHAFFRAEVPFLFFFTGIHDDYHRLGDHADKLDYARMRDILHLSFRVVDRLSRLPKTPRFVRVPG